MADVLRDPENYPVSILHLSVQLPMKSLLKVQDWLGPMAHTNEMVRRMVFHPL